MESVLFRGVGVATNMPCIPQHMDNCSSWDRMAKCTMHARNLVSTLLAFYATMPVSIRFSSFAFEILHLVKCCLLGCCHCHKLWMVYTRSSQGSENHSLKKSHVIKAVQRSCLLSTKPSFNCPCEIPYPLGLRTII